jgi:integrase/recombinase XerD
MNNLQNFKELMFLKNFSEKTINSYLKNLQNVSSNIGKDIDVISETDLRKYLMSKKHYSSSSRMMIINAWKCFYKLCLEKEFDHKILPRPIVEQKHPDILSIEEMQMMIDSIENVKHKTIVCLMYSCGMRVSEVVDLKIKDIDSKNSKIIIRNGKGKVDRIVMLDSGILDLMRKYWSAYATKEYLFEGSKGGKYSVKSVQTIVKNAANKIGIKKKISSHLLRHSCLTQLIKDGIDLRTVQKIAGHKNINTTAGYIKIIDVDIIGTKSPISNIKM